MSRRQQVIDAIISKLEGIAGVGEVSYVFKTPERVSKKPAFLVHTGGFQESKERFPTRSKQAELVILITVYEDWDPKGTKLNAAVALAETALETDPTLGLAFVIDTWVAGISSLEDELETAGPINRSDMEVRSIYRHSRGTP